MTFCVSGDTQAIKATARWGQYLRVESEQLVEREVRQSQAGLEAASPWWLENHHAQGRPLWAVSRGRRA